jgi:uncharacterized protein YegJ (DUF2314 family)
VESQYWIWGAVAAVAAVAGAILYWRRRQRTRSRLISFVALLREPVTFDPAVLASVAGKAWNADLGDGTSEGADGFVAGAEITNMIMCRGQMHIVNCFSRPYVDDHEKMADGIPDMRLRSLFREHQAWFSCDALGVDYTTSDEEIRDSYRRLGKLFADLVDERCLLILVPDTDRAYPINEDTDAALRSDDPLANLQETLTAPMIEVPPDDPLMEAAVEKARQGWPTFVEAYEAGAGENFSVKAPVTHAENTEFIWIAVTSIEGDRVYGTLGNDPVDLGPLTLGSKVSVPLAELNDWLYLDRQGNMAGGFTLEAVSQAAQRRR